MKKLVLTTLFLTLILVLAACGGGESDESSGDTGNSNDNSGETTEESGEESSDSGEAAMDNKLDIVATDFEFNKEEYTVQSGEEVTVTLTSKEGTHGITIEGTDVNIQGEGKATFTPEEPGEYMIHCSVPCGEGHSGMMSTLIVK
ncbi:cytochrome C oxidase subunit II [Virgibacillus flavescens]|uniref:cytochrome C oxidase subunit II n=1 Tax=Virgibacillus flavescens TaxID=1611422 RepID=UPI003D34AB75